MSQHATINETAFSVGDTLRLSQEIVEGDKKRIQLFEGIVIAIKNRGINKTMTIRKIATSGIGVEKIFPLALPSIKKVEVRRKGDVRRSKLYFLRDRIGKAATRIKEQSFSAEVKAQ